MNKCQKSIEDSNMNFIFQLFFWKKLVLSPIHDQQTVGVHNAHSSTCTFRLENSPFYISVVGVASTIHVGFLNLRDEARLVLLSFE